jgi:hypothetical protein
MLPPMLPLIVAFVIVLFKLVFIKLALTSASFELYILVIGNLILAFSRLPLLF